ncbi:MAG: site-specific integrase, partial [Bacteroidetes bacterium]|nr:site-specific integrase [Bacteroidota bacterium]
MALASLAPSTVIAYNKIIEELKAFMLSLDDSICVFPVSGMHIALFMSHLYRKGFAPSTIATKLSAIAFWHQIYYKEDPTSHFMIRRILHGMKKSRPSVSLRPPLTFADLNAMRRVVGQLIGSVYEKHLVWAMIVVSFHAFLRAGEMTK